MSAGVGNLQAAALAALRTADPRAKVEAVDQLVAAFARGRLEVSHPLPAAPIIVPGRPEAPQLVPPARLERRSLGSPRGRAALVHAVAHIEFNAINLALDAAYRFPGMPRKYYADWLSVAADEARHFSLLAQRLAELDSAYGAFPAHNGLWEMAIKTAHCGLTRMALVPRVLEARGLDVSPAMIRRLEGAGDETTAAILRVILREEEAHVEIGTRWFHYFCEQAGVDPTTTFVGLLQQHADGLIRGPFNEPARRRSGFVDAEMAVLHAMDRRAAS